MSSDPIEKVFDSESTPASSLDQFLDDVRQAASEDDLFELLARQRPPSSKLARERLRSRLSGLLKNKLKELRSSASPVKTADAWLQEGGGGEELQGEEFAPEDVEPWDSPVDGTDVLDELVALFDAYLYASAEQLIALALWSPFSFVYDLFGICPLIDLMSPTHRCGKTTACVLLRHLCNRALLSGNISPPSIYRSVSKWKPTLIIDEADSFAKLSDELRGILNAGHTRDTAFAVRSEGDSNEPRMFSTWAPKVVAAIGHLPVTIEDRAIKIALVRKPTKVTKRDAFDPDGVRADCRDVRARLARWALDNLDAISTAKVERPAELDDRQWNNWRPLLMIASVAGTGWLAKATKAAQALSAVEVDVDAEDIGVLALRHVWEAVEPVKQMATVDVLKALIARDDGGPWAKWWEAKVARDETKGPSAHLARLLRPFGIRPKQYRDGDKKMRGYLAEDFKEDSVASYLEKDGTNGTDGTTGSSSQAGCTDCTDCTDFAEGARVRVSGDEDEPVTEPVTEQLVMTEPGPPVMTGEPNGTPGQDEIAERVRRDAPEPVMTDADPWGAENAPRNGDRGWG